MDWTALLENGLWAALFAAALAFAYTAPVRALPVVLAAGFAGRFSRDLLTQLGVALPMATALAALAATVLAVIAARGERASVPVAAVTAVLTLGPTTLLFSAVRAAFNVFAKDPAVAAAASAAFTVNSLKSLVVIAAMAIGTAAPLLVSRDRY